jgi:ketosteroid isomerase-like protein
MFMPLCILAQNWAPDEKLILERVKTGNSSWQDAVNNKDLSIWLKAADPTDDLQAWWSQDGGLWNLDDTKRNFEFLHKDVKKNYWITFKPISIKVYSDVAFIWFYNYYANEDLKGNTKTIEEKRFEVYRKIDGKWRWSAGMIVQRPTEL